MNHPALMPTVVRVPDSFDASLPEIPIQASRRDLAQTRWRALAADGTPFEFALERPLRDGTTVGTSPDARYVVRQQPERVLAIRLEVAASAAAGIGWALGNAHLEASASANELLTPEGEEARALLGRLRVPYEAKEAVFIPGRFARGKMEPAELGSGHRHPGGN